MAFTPFHMIKAGFGRLRRPGFDARAALELSRLGVPFFPTTRYALAPSALLTVVNDIMINGRKVILELGCGMSSIYSAKALLSDGARDGGVIIVDASAEWLDLVMERARAAGCADIITPVHAPMTALSQGGDWYDTQQILDGLAGRKIDLLLVDGPVASGGAPTNARAPAIPILKDHLNDRCAIYLDDVHRTSHAEIAEAWGNELNLKFAEHHARGGFARAARGNEFDPVI